MDQIKMLRNKMLNLGIQCTTDSVAAVVCEPESQSACGQVGLLEHSLMLLKTVVPLIHISRVRLLSWGRAIRFFRLQRHLWGQSSSAASTNHRQTQHLYHLHHKHDHHADEIVKVEDWVKSS